MITLQRGLEDGYYIHQIGPTFFSLQVSHDAPGAILRFNRPNTPLLRAYRARLLSPTVQAYSEFRSVERLVASYDNRSVFHSRDIIKEKIRTEVAMTDVIDAEKRTHLFRRHGLLAFCTIRLINS